MRGNDGRISLSALALALALPAIALAPTAGHAQTGDEARRRESLATFAGMAPVLQHPRCLNCHSVTQYPTQGNDKRRHISGVVRGADDKGAAGLRCVSCHQPSNNASSRAPGALHWQMPPISMGWEGKTPAELCRTLVDPVTNGGRDPAAIARHMREDPLVQWAWSPGSERSAPPIDRSAFHTLAKTWADTGAACPD